MWVSTEDGRGKEILINDTIGFIRDLPPNLVDAFSSTLEDSIESQILLHVIDASDPKVTEKIRVVDDILLNIGAKQKKIYVFNKIDQVSEEPIEIGTDEGTRIYDNKLEYIKEVYKDLEPIFISAGKNT
jgi:GTP-binding protein HflX